MNFISKWFRGNWRCNVIKLSNYFDIL